MKINHNDSAVLTNVKLLRNENFLTESMERLSTGLKINHASDSPAGMAISHKMQAQINGLDQASRNSSDGLSVLQTTDGAMNELTSILQRIRELAVQAANDTNSNSDRDAIQTEIDQLTVEIDRIADASEFNTKRLLDGSLDTHSYGDHTSRRQVSDSVPEGFYNMTVTQAATQTTLDYTIPFPIPADESQTIVVNGSLINVDSNMTEDEYKEAIIKGCERGDVIAEYNNGGNWTFKTVDYGASANLIFTDVDGNLVPPDAQGKDTEITPDPTSAFKDHPNATFKYDDNRVIITDVNGFEMSFKLQEGYMVGATDKDGNPYPDNGKISIEVTDKGPMDIQVGANAYQQIAMRIPAVDLDNMYLDKVNVRTFDTASKAIGRLDNAINYINTARAKVGAYSNRLEHTVENLDSSEENMTAAISRITDVDMAEEMTEYTKQNVLVQAAQSALSQANEIPQMALQLLQ